MKKTEDTDKHGALKTKVKSLKASERQVVTIQIAVSNISYSWNDCEPIKRSLGSFLLCNPPQGRTSKINLKVLPRDMIMVC